MRTNSAWIVAAGLLFQTGTVMLWSSEAAAQFCPPGSRQIQVGPGLMCQCPDGSYGSIYGCPQRAPQAQPQRKPPSAEDNARATARLIAEMDRELERGRISALDTEQISDAARLNRVPKPAGYEYTPTKPLDISRPNNPSLPAAAGAALSGLGKSVTTNNNVNQWGNGGASQINAFPSQPANPAPTFPPVSKPGVVGQIGTGMKQIGKDIWDLPANTWKFGTSYFGAAKAPAPTNTAAPTQAPATRPPTSLQPANTNYQSVGTGQQTAFGEISTISPTPQYAPPAAMAPNSVNAPYFGVTSTFGPSAAPGK